MNTDKIVMIMRFPSLLYLPQLPLFPFLIFATDLQVGLGIGYRYGRSYALSFAQIALQLSVVVPTPAGNWEISG